MRALRAASGVAPFARSDIVGWSGSERLSRGRLLLPVFSVGYSAMSRRVTAGGGFAPYVRAALGNRSGRPAGYLSPSSPTLPRTEPLRPRKKFEGGYHGFTDPLQISWHPHDEGSAGPDEDTPVMPDRRAKMPTRMEYVTGPTFGSKGASERHPEARHRSVRGRKYQSDLSSSLTR